MDKHEIRTQEFTAQVRREIYIMRCLKHRHIVRMSEVLTSDTKLYIVMELVTGGELFECIEKGPVSEDLARHYFQQLVDGVDFCHKKGVAHRDLKPENLLLDENGDIKITDFGFSSMKGMDVNTGLLYTQCGTPDYCAPEIIGSAQNGYTGAKVDAWSCGIILYALLCGRLPFQEPDTDKLYDLILACQVKYPPFISEGARDLLQNLLVRDPNKRFDLQKVKRHPWFLVDYEGDDARLLKKRPFFNKNQIDLKGSTPSSPSVTPKDPSILVNPPSIRAPSPTSDSLTVQNPIARTPTSTNPSNSAGFSAPTIPVTPPSTNAAHPSAPITFPTSAPNSHPSISAPQNASSLSASKYRPNSLPATNLNALDAQRSFDGDDPSTYGCALPQVPSLAPQPPISSPPHSQEAVPSRISVPSHAHHTTQLQPIVDAGTPRNIHTGPSANRLREDPYASFRPASPATDIAVHARTPTPPTHDVFTKVEDRPATPARRQQSASTVAAYKAAVAAASAQGSELAPDGTQSPAKSAPYSGHALSSTQMSPIPGPGQQPMSNGIPSSLDSNGFPSGGEANRMDDSSSEQDSVEDYENKPAPLLEMPANPRQVLRQTKDGRKPFQSSSALRQPRQRSDLTGMAATNGVPSHSTIEPISGSTSVSAPQRARRSYARDGTHTGSVNDVLAIRLARPDGPSSPTVVYSPAPVSGPAYDRYPSMSPGFSGMRPMSAHEDEGTSSGYGPSSGGPSHNMPWQSSSNQTYNTSRDDGPHSARYHAQTLSQHLWNMVNKLRGTAEPANIKVSKELRKDMMFFVNELNHLNKVEDILAIFTNFLSYFESFGLCELPSSSQSFGTQNGDDDFDSRTNDELHVGGGDVRPGAHRRTGTDISSEEEPVSLSPIVADTTGHHLSDLARRRNLSDLLTKWMKTADRRMEEGTDGDGSAPVVDIAELQRLMREHQSGREESNLADDLLRLMNASEDGSSTAYGNGGGQPGHSPPSPQVPASRSGDSYSQTRYLSNLSSGNGMGRPSNPRSISNNNAPLPSEYVPGRFKEPNSMPSRGRNGNDRQTGLSGRSDARPSVDGHVESGSTGRTGEDAKNMANSMGMHDVPYYVSDKKVGMANKLRGVLQTMKAKNHRLAEHHAQFRSSLPADEIMRLLVRVLQNMGGKVTIKKETKRKMKCQLVLKPNGVLHAGIELLATEDDLTSVAFRRSRADKGKTNIDSFHSFFEQVRASFIDEANAMYPTLKMTTANAASRRRRHNRDDSSRHMSDTGQSSVSGS